MFFQAIDTVVEYYSWVRCEYGCIAQFERMSTIYLIRASNGMFKIGMASNPRARIAGLQTGSPLELKLVHRRSVPKAHARRAEKRIHKSLRRYRVRGEWFSGPVDLAIAEIDRITLREEQLHAHTQLFEHGDEIGQLVQSIEIVCKHCGHRKTLTLTIAQIAGRKFRCSECHGLT